MSVSGATPSPSSLSRASSPPSGRRVTGCRRAPPAEASWPCRRRRRRRRRRSRSMDRKAISSGRSAAEKQSVRRMILGEIGDAGGSRPRDVFNYTGRDGGYGRRGWTERCGLGPHAPQPSIQTTRPLRFLPHAQYVATSLSDARTTNRRMSAAISPQSLTAARLVASFEAHFTPRKRS